MTSGSLLDRLSATTPAEARRPFEDALHAGVPFRTNVVLLRDDGLLCPVEVLAQPVGAATGIWASCWRHVREQADQARHSAADPRPSDFLDRLPVGLVLYDKQDRLVYWNRTYAGIMGPNAELLCHGVPFEQIMTRAYRRGHAASDGQDVETMIATRLARHRAGDTFEEALSANRWLMTHEIPIGDGGTLGVRVDISESKRRTLATFDGLGATLVNAALDTAIERVGEGIALFDAEDRLMMCNGVYREFHRRSHGREPVVGTPYEDLVRNCLNRGLILHDFAEDEEFLRYRMDRHRRAVGPMEVHFSDDRWFLINDSVLPDGGIVLIQTDITELKDREAKLVSARDAAEAAARAVGGLLAEMSHELRTPLHAIIGFAEVMSKEAFGHLGSEHYREYVQRIRDSGGHLLGLINDILDLSKVRAGKLELSESPVVLGELVEETVQLMAQRAKDCRLTLTNETVPGIAPIVRIDARKVTQILFNLLSNAIKFTPAGGEITVTIARDPSGDALIKVADTGVGMTDSEIQVALSKYGQVAHPGLTVHGGTGLGLPLSLELARMHGGDLTVESARHHGTTAILRLPALRIVAPGDAA